MTPLSRSTLAAQRPRPRGSVVLAYALCPLLLAMSGYGFFQWLKIPVDTHLMGVEELFYLICLVVLPLVLFLFLSVVAAQRLEFNKFSSSYQIRLDQLQKRLNGQEDFLHALTDSNPEATVIFDKNNRYWFVNNVAAHNLDRDAGDIVGVSPVKIIGNEKAKKLMARLNEVSTSGHPMETLDQVADENNKIRFIQTRYEVLAPFGDFTGGVMLREEDMTNLIVERERRENMLNQVIGALVAVVDRRDPYAAGHSARVGQLSRVIAEEMMLDEKEIEAAAIAGSLMNFGKLLVSRSILTKTSALTAEELQRVRESMLISADILSIIDFVGPVVLTLRQVLERFDGSGEPLGLKGDAILVTARIVTVANACVALVSPRAHRPSLGTREAIDYLMRDADKLYDRRVVVALSQFVENRARKLDWLTVNKQD